MMGKRDVDQLIHTEQKMLDQAAQSTVKLDIALSRIKDGTLTTTVSVENMVGHKLLSGVGFRRAFLSFEVLNELGQVLWASEQTDGAGRRIGPDGAPLPGELW